MVIKSLIINHYAELGDFKWDMVSEGYILLSFGPSDNFDGISASHFWFSNTILYS